MLIKLNDNDIKITKVAKNNFATFRKLNDLDNNLYCPYCNSKNKQLKLVSENVIICKKCHRTLTLKDFK